MSGEHVYTDDDAGQLLTAIHPPASGLADEAYTNDANGNRTSWAGHPPDEVAYDPTADLLEQDDRSIYGHDFEGRLTVKEDRDTGAETRFVWNSFDELVAVVHPDCQGAG